MKELTCSEVTGMTVRQPRYSKEEFATLGGPQNGTVNNAWGTDFYRSDSSICSAAVHAGVIDVRDGGKIQIRIRPREKFYNGTPKNGVISSRYSNDAWSL
jgi:LCCL domain